ncbi:hypothetical protein MNVI_03630 [Mycobacterium noviomagense]|uniref:Chitin-binding type-2 domain-containing protein n=1 Tax=Mycobacterium noviomagense TaxID=459858 RepID=A0A7I7P8Y9_9MYCO|nr:hypothetical protein MNVI_03630 [Mycobacterium noviomagense]
MSSFIGRVVSVVALALAPMTYVTAVSVGISPADPPACGAGSWWDPGTNACQPLGPPPPPPECGRGEWFNHVTNECQPVSPSFRGYGFHTSTAAIGSPSRAS